MQNIIVDKLNDVYIKIDADASIRRELSDYFSFEVPGYKFTPQFRNRVWDGKIRLYSYATGQMYVGLYPYLKDWCNKKDIHIVEIQHVRRLLFFYKKEDRILLCLLKKRHFC